MEAARRERQDGVLRVGADYHRDAAFSDGKPCVRSHFGNAGAVDGIVRADAAGEGFYGPGYVGDISGVEYIRRAVFSGGFQIFFFYVAGDDPAGSGDAGALNGVDPHAADAENGDGGAGTHACGPHAGAEARCDAAADHTGGGQIHFLGHGHAAHVRYHRVFRKGGQQGGVIAGAAVQRHAGGIVH